MRCLKYDCPKWNMITEKWLMPYFFDCATSKTCFASKNLMSHAQQDSLNLFDYFCCNCFNICIFWAKASEVKIKHSQKYWGLPRLYIETTKEKSTKMKLMYKLLVFILSQSNAEMFLPFVEMYVYRKYFYSNITAKFPCSNSRPFHMPFHNNE